ncbi:cellular tumor antigen p53-like [Phlebotomus argentipes]|uniref:cellular tumor antigen p53-like n=1 Tax=Phlebotomus argentipes TaxID=94469 RepID=UPI0028933317|nr:cellular tumor antigen p53-like [Phlebotomus argentipes]XP_059619662.1 cellular tumor antigen p53-like [Phlebotomus argentipes]
MVDNNDIKGNFDNTDFPVTNSQFQPIDTEELMNVVQTMDSQDVINCFQGVQDDFGSSQVTVSQEFGQYLLASEAEVFNVDQKPEPEHWNQFPTLNEMPGDANFSVGIPAVMNNSNWNYSDSLKKIFIKINTLLNLDISYNRKRCNGTMFLRAMIVYPDFHYMPVVICNNHKDMQKQNGHNIIRCPHANVNYVGHEKGANFKERLALIFPLGTSVVKSENDDYVKSSVTLEFACQNSCPTGINRKTTVLSLTLEDENGFMYGQRLINFKVCTVPKRDCQNEEQPPKKRKSAGSGQPSNGKRPCYSVVSKVVKEEDTGSSGSQCERVSSSESLTGVSCKITMPDLDSMHDVLTYAHDRLAGKILNNPEKSHSYGKHIKAVKKLQQSLPSSSAKE